MKTFPKLFKYSSTGKVQEWSIVARQAEDGVTAYYAVSWGQKDGKKQVGRVDIKKGKNIGRSNETTPLEQAISEAQSKWNLQLDKGYSPGAPKATKKTSPMLAKPYDKEKGKVTFPSFVQPKLDGIRCIAFRDEAGDVQLISRRGKAIETLPHINKALLEIMESGSILDGELYIHGESFQTITSWVKKARPESLSVQYHIYDVINDEAFNKRLEIMASLHEINTSPHLRFVTTREVNSHEEVIELHKTATSWGYEGVMLRVGDCKYKCGGRSSKLLKVKTFFDDEYEIVGAYENKGKQKGQCTLICKTKSGAEFGVKPMGTDEERRQIWEDFKAGLLTGKMYTVRYFELTSSDDPVPRFPIGVGVREFA